jgi:aminoglycoside phosphotransferase (APT) family kinase protein
MSTPELIRCRLCAQVHMDFAVSEKMPSRRELVDLYLKRNGRRIECFDFYPCFGFFRPAVIARQIYYRYYHGQARDEHFKMQLVAVRVLEEAALRVMKGSIK